MARDNTKAWQHQGTRLVGILDRVQLFAKVGDILVGGSQNMIASGVWAVFKLSLQVATGYLGLLEKVSAFFMHISQSLLDPEGARSAVPRLQGAAGPDV